MMMIKWLKKHQKFCFSSSNYFLPGEAVLRFRKLVTPPREILFFLANKPISVRRSIFNSFSKFSRLFERGWFFWNSREKISRNSEIISRKKSAIKILEFFFLISECRGKCRKAIRSAICSRSSMSTSEHFQKFHKRWTKRTRKSENEDARRWPKTKISGN